MELKYCYTRLDLSGMSVSEVIAALQAWEAQNPEAVNTYLEIYDRSAEIRYYRPYTAAELEIITFNQEKVQAAKKAKERAEYERLKEKYGN